MSATHRHPSSVLRCDFCGRVVRPTQHTRTTYRVDYYALHGGHGERCELPQDYGHRATTYIRLLDHYQVITCVECYAREAVQAECERRFRPEQAAAEEASA